jgi:dienelactone hydrolase
MSFRLSLSSCFLVILAGVGCSAASPETDDLLAGGDGAANLPIGDKSDKKDGATTTPSGTGESSSTSGTTGGASNGGSGGAIDANGGASVDSGGGGSIDSGAGGGASGRSKCGAPLDTNAPTAASIVRDGPLSVTSYSSGLPSSTAYKSLTVFYPPKGTGPHVVVMISPGLTEILAYLRGWAVRFASHGYVAVFVEANNTGSDSAASRADGMWAAIRSIKGENTRTGSPLAGKLSDCIVTSGHSLGGGASLSVANAHPNDIKGALAFNPYDPTTNFSKIVAPTLILTGQNDSTAAPGPHGRRQYDSMSAGISKEYVEIAGGNHQSALFVSAVPSQYSISWIKFAVDGDMRFRPFLDKRATGLSEFATTLP